MADDMKKIKQGLGLSESEIGTPRFSYSEWALRRITRLEQLSREIEKITGYALDELRDKFLAGYTLESPPEPKSFAEEMGLSESEMDAYQELPAQEARPTVYVYRERGRDYCRTEGSDHYQLPGVEPMDLIISCDYAEHHCLANIIKYAVRFGESGNLKDLKKIADYAHILAGVELAKEGDK